MPVYQVPDGLRDVVVNPMLYHAVMGLALLACAVLLVMATRAWFRDRNAIFIGCLLGGALAALTEPFYDILGGIYHYGHGVPVLFTWGERPIPLHILFAYIAYIGGSAYMSYAVLSHPGSTARRFFIAAILSAAFNAFAEQTMTAAGLYIYYGDQPLWLAGYSYAWMPNNIGSVAIGAIIYANRARLKGLSGLWVIFLVPSGLIAWEFWVGWPLFAAMNTGLGYAMTYPAAACGALIAIFTTRMIADLIYSSAQAGAAMPAKNSGAGIAVEKPHQQSVYS